MESEFRSTIYRVVYYIHYMYISLSKTIFY